MTQEEKDLLLKDLCARLPYGLMIKQECATTPAVLQSVDIYRNTVDVDFVSIGRWGTYNVKYIKPYLRPMSSMTEDEDEELDDISEKCGNCHISEVGIRIADLVSDFCNRHHFDYRGLIEKGLALEAPKDMYNGNKN